MKSYNSHLNSAKHKKKVNQETESSYTLPDEFDSDAYCSVCERSYKTKLHYRKYLRHFHKMDLTPTNRSNPNLNVSPNPSNANNYCDSCNWTFSDKEAYMYHLQAVHKMGVPKWQKHHLIQTSSQT